MVPEQISSQVLWSLIASSQHTTNNYLFCKQSISAYQVIEADIIQGELHYDTH